MLELALDRFDARRRHLRLPLGHRPAVPHALAPRATRSTRRARRTRRAIRPSRLAHAHDIERFYRDVDRDRSARVRERLPPKARCSIVMSDHGFQPYTRKLHLNAWLRDKGYLVLKDGKRTGQIGLGRRRLVALARLRPRLQRAVPESRRPRGAGHRAARRRRRAAHEIARAARGRCATRKTGERVVLRGVPRRGDVPRRSASPRLRTSWSATTTATACSDPSTLGEITEAVLEDNTSRWSGQPPDRPPQVSRGPAGERAGLRRAGTTSPT